MKFAQYPKAEDVKPSDLLLIDGEDGTRSLPINSEGYFEALDEILSGADQRNRVYRGKDLSSGFTTEQQQGLKDGTFKGLFIGDYINWEHVYTVDNIRRGGKIVIAEFYSQNRHPYSWQVASPCGVLLYCVETLRKNTVQYNRDGVTAKNTNVGNSAVNDECLILCKTVKQFLDENHPYLYCYNTRTYHLDTPENLQVSTQFGTLVGLYDLNMAFIGRDVRGELAISKLSPDFYLEDLNKAYSSVSPVPRIFVQPLTTNDGHYTVQSLSVYNPRQSGLNHIDDNARYAVPFLINAVHLDNAS